MKSVMIARRRRRETGFTLAELLVSIVVVVIITLIASEVMTSATAITRSGNKHFDTDTQARVVLDRMALDFAQIVKRTDVDYYVKQKVYKGHGNGHGCGQGHNNDLSSDQIAFYSQVPGYYPSATVAEQSPISLVAYRVNEGNSPDRYGKFERMAKGLRWNGVDNTTGNNATYPIVFQTGQIDNSCTGNQCPCNGTIGPWANVWSAAICNTNNSSDQDYEVLGSGVFRFEYYYMLKNGRVTDWPWDRFDFPTRQTIFYDPSYPQVRIGLSQVRSIGVTIAVIDPASRALIQQAHSANAAYGDILDVAAALPDFKNTCGRGNSQRAMGTLETDWKTVIESIARTGQTDGGLLIPPEAAKGIRVYNRYFDLKIW